MVFCSKKLADTLTKVRPELCLLSCPWKNLLFLRCRAGRAFQALGAAVGVASAAARVPALGVAVAAAAGAAPDTPAFTNHFAPRIFSF